MFRRLTKEKANLAREIDEGINFGTSHASKKEKKKCQFQFGEGKTKEHSMCVGDCIDSGRDRFTSESVLYTNTV